MLDGDDDHSAALRCSSWSVYERPVLRVAVLVLFSLVMVLALPRPGTMIFHQGVRLENSSVRGRIACEQGERAHTDDGTAGTAAVQDPAPPAAAALRPDPEVAAKLRFDCRDPASVSYPQRHIAFLLSMHEWRENLTKANMERALPNFFHWDVQRPIALDAPELIHTRNMSTHTRKLWSNRLSYARFWTDLRDSPRFACLPDDAWVFILEDDCNINTDRNATGALMSPADVAAWKAENNASLANSASAPTLLFNFTRTLLDVMGNGAAVADGFFNLGAADISFGAFNEAAGDIRHTDTMLWSARGSGAGLHAAAYTKRRAASLPTDIAANWTRLHPWAIAGYTDRMVQSIMSLENRRPVVWGGGSVEPGNPRLTPHLPQHGFVFQDRAAMPTTLYG